MMSFPRPTCIAPLLVALLAACGGGGGADAPSEPPPVVTPLSLSATTLSLVPGEKSSLAASGGGTAAVQWRSDNAAVVTVSATGEVSAVAPGSTDIVATRGSATARAAVTVGQGGIVGSTGGKVSTTDSTVVVQVPTGAVPGSTKVEVKTVPDPTGNAISAVMQVGPPGGDGTPLAAPATIEIALDQSKIPSFREPSDLRIGRLVNGRWQLVATQLVQVAHAAFSGSRGITASSANLFHRWSYYSPISYWGYYSVVDPCSPVSMTDASTANAIATVDCPFPLPTGGKRYSDYYRLTIPNGEVQRFSVTASFVGILGIKENTADAKVGMVHGSMRSNDAVTQHFRVVGNGNPMQVFLSGIDSASLGAYTITRSTVTDAHVCEDYDFVLPGSSFTTTLTEGNSCAGKIAYTNDPAALGKPILYQDYTLKVKKDVPVTITLKGSTAFNPVLTVFGYDPAKQQLYVMAQSLGTETTRTLTVTPPYDGYIYPEAASGRSDGKGGWITPTGTYSMTISSF